MTADVGQTLRKARASREIELSDVEQETKIRAKYLRAIEEERWEELPGEPYTRAFLVSYAEFLELDPEPLVAAYRSEHVRIEEPTPVPETMLPQRGHGAPLWASARLVLAVIVAAALALVGVVAVTGGSEESGNGNGPAPGAGGSGHQSTVTSTTEQTPAHPPRVKVELRSTGTVWVCLVDDRGRPLVDGETLTPDEQRGPFKGHGFEATFGNGAIAMTVDGNPVAIPDPGEPIGYSIRPSGVDPLGASSRPTCV